MESENESSKINDVCGFPIHIHWGTEGTVKKERVKKRIGNYVQAERLRYMRERGKGRRNLSFLLVLPGDFFPSRNRKKVKLYEKKGEKMRVAGSWKMAEDEGDLLSFIAPSRPRSPPPHPFHQLFHALTSFFLFSFCSLISLFSCRTFSLTLCKGTNVQM